MKKAIVFGIAGQDGFYLKKLLQEHKIDCIGVSRSKGSWISGSVVDKDLIEKLIKEHKPDYVFHLAANSTTRHDVLFENHEVISTGTLNILESVYRHSPKTKVFLSGSGLQFINKGLPISEKDEFEASSAYSVSRIHSVYAARYYRTLGLKAYVGYFFNHDSPLRSERHVNQKIVESVKRIASGSTETLELGNITVKKEFTFAGDTVEAIFKLIENDEVYEAVIGSGKAYAIKEWLDICFGYFGLDWKNHVVLKNDFKSEYDILVSNPQTIFSLGWKPKVDIDQLAKMMITHK